MKMLVNVLLLVTLLALSGCGAMNIDDFADNQPALRLEQYFLGHTRAWGIFEDRFGNLRRSFQVDIKGYLDNGELVLEEDFLYNDGERDRRVWRIISGEDGSYRGSADDVVGEATGRVAGNALHWQYQMNLAVADSHYRVKFNDWMFLLPGDVLVNKADISKWGIRLGTVSLFFSKTDQSSMIDATSPAQHDSDFMPSTKRGEAVTVRRMTWLQ
jgi:hypothetical protein